MIITEEILNKAMSAKGGWSAKQLRCIVPDFEYIGRSAFPSKGWKFRIIGKNVDSEQITQFLALRKKDKREKTGNLFAQKPRGNVKYADFDAIMCIDDQNHMDSINQELRSA